MNIKCIYENILEIVIKYKMSVRVVFSLNDNEYYTFAYFMKPLKMKNNIFGTYCKFELSIFIKIKSFIRYVCKRSRLLYVTIMISYNLNPSHILTIKDFTFELLNKRRTMFNAIQTCIPSFQVLYIRHKFQRHQS
jgi:hypothetical protein